MATISLLLLLISFYFLTLANLMCFTIAKAENYIIHMDLEAMPKAFSNHHNWYKSTIDSISTTTPSSSKLLYTYTHAIQGFSASLTESELEILKSSLGYLHSTPDSPVVLDTTYTPKFLGLNEHSGAWPSSNYGKDVIIGLMDTGVWPESKSYNDDGFTEPPSRWKGICQSGTLFNSSMCNNKLIGARYFNKGLVAKMGRDKKISMNSPRDTKGHGTHTSSTAAGSRVADASYLGYASGISTGMAPLARLAIYKVSWDEGGTHSDYLAGIDAAIFDGVNIISMSVGYNTHSLLHDVIAIATFAAVEKGIFVSLSSGNDGRKKIPLHNGTPWALTVAAGTVDRRFGGTITLGNDIKVKGDSLYQNATVPKNAPLALMNKCDDSAALSVLRNDTVVVCLDPNGTDVNDQSKLVGDAGLAGGIFITRAGYTYIKMGGRRIHYPTFFVDWKTGITVMEYVNKTGSSGRVSFELGTTFVGSSVAPEVAAYSSRGPSPTCPTVLKPDIMAPGQSILAAWPSSFSPVTYIDGTSIYNDFYIDTGTSMACPHASGVAALLKGAHPEWSPAMIRSAMMTTADTLDNSGGPIRDQGMDGEPASALAMGAGHINPNKALEPGLVYDADQASYVDFLCSLNYTTEQIKVFTKSSPFDCSRELTELNYPSLIVFVSTEDLGSGPVKKVFRRTVTNVGPGAATYSVKLTEVDGIEVRVVPKKLDFMDMYDKADYNVTVTVTGKMAGNEVLDGSLTWFDSEKKYVVRSPIVVVKS